ncbi:IS3 family transposase [Pseudomonas sp. KNUC1026]|uniref:IS3 family transposase n=1 Tax=Pseudomonas sp. KNUC1026 TaxID=2893890 RepID=UPI001F35159D|nr:IS3 family transposase [Pseudomonas sp. KNUC1026]UFH49776.1 IS3 family transposase [Pseudomonas sp. KNUC1026]
MAGETVTAPHRCGFQPGLFHSDRQLGAAVLQWRTSSLGYTKDRKASRHAKETRQVESRHAPDRRTARLQEFAGRSRIPSHGERLPKKAQGASRGESEATRTRAEKTRIVSELRSQFPLDNLLSLIGLSRSTYYYQLKAMAAPDKHAPLKALIQSIQTQHKGRYGYRWIEAALGNEGHVVNGKRVRRLMAELGLKCTVRPKRYKSFRGEPGRIAENILERQFDTDRPNCKWVTDVTEFKVNGERLYLSPVLDLFNGEIVAYQVDTSPHYALVGRMLDKALAKLPEGICPLMHSDQGWQYQYYRYRHRLAERGLTQSMSRRGNCLDNAAMESFFGTLKSEMYYRQRFTSTAELAAAIDEYIHYYNHDRIKMKLGGLSPVAYRTQVAMA